jgi:hypothetical protein
VTPPALIERAGAFEYDVMTGSFEVSAMLMRVLLVV